jgi:hypothetical protein
MDKLTFRVHALLMLIVLLAFIWTIHLINTNKYKLGTIVAPVYVSVELQSRYCETMQVIVGNKTHTLSTTSEPASDTAPVICGAKKDVSEGEGIKNLALAIKSAQYDEVMDSINNVAVIIGSKTYYFSRAELANWAKEKTGEYTRLIAPDSVKYIDGLFRHYVNYYGDANFIINALLMPLAHPDICTPIIMAALILILLYRPNWILNNGASLDSLSACFTGRRELATLIAILFVGLLIRLNGYDFHTGWLDEIVSATRYGNPNGNFMDTFMDPGNPPLYYLLLHSWFMLFGWSEGAGRMLSVVIGTAGIATMYTFLRHHASIGAALIGSLLVALSGYSLSYSHEMRSYILVFALVPLVLDALFSFVKAPGFRPGALFVLWGTLLVNTHYFGVFIISTGFLFGAYWLWRNGKRCEVGILLGLCLIIALSLVPYFYVTAFKKALIDTSCNKWIKPPELSALPNLARFITGDVTMFWMLLAGGVIALISMRKNDCTSSAHNILIYAVICSTIVAMLVYVESVAYRSIWVARYFTILTPLYIATVAVCASVRLSILRTKAGDTVRIGLVLCALHYGIGATHVSWDKSIAYPSLTYIASDIAAHKGESGNAIVFGKVDLSAAYYHLDDMPIRRRNGKEIAIMLSGANIPTTIYAESLHISDNNLADMFNKAGVKYPLKIQVSQDKYIYKAYIETGVKFK